MLDTIAQESVRIIAYHPDPKKKKKFERAPYFFAPQFGSDGNPVYGFDEPKNMERFGLDENEVEKMRRSLNWTEESSEVIKHMQKLDIVKNVRDKAIYLWLLCEVPEIAHSKNKVTVKQRFYIENKEEEAKVNTQMYTIKTKALLLAQQIVSQGEKISRDNARLLGLPVKGLSASQVIASILSNADNSPSAFLKIFDDKNKDYKIFISKIVDRGLVLKNRSGSFSHGDKDNVIAVSENQMIEFLQSKENGSIVNMWAKEIGDVLIQKATESTKPERGPVEKNASVTCTPKEAVSIIGSLNDIGSIEQFVHGEERKVIVSAATEKINSLKQE